MNLRKDHYCLTLFFALRENYVLQSFALQGVTHFVCVTEQKFEIVYVSIVHYCVIFLSHKICNKLCYNCTLKKLKKLKKILAVDHSAHMSMKDAAKCES